MTSKIKLFSFLFVMCLTLFSCEKAPSLEKPEKFEINKSYDRGPMKLVVKVSQKEITIAEQITLALDVTIPEDYEVEMPGFVEKILEFGIVSYNSPSPTFVPGGKILLQKSWRLEPFLSGTYKIPPFKLFFAPKGTEKEKKHELETEEIEIKVASLLQDKVGEWKLHDITGPVNLENKVGPLFYYAFLAWVIVTGIAIAIFYWLARRKKKEFVAPPRSAHEIAYEDLERLLAEDLLSRGEIKLFYNRVCDILRYYIENRFGLRAPERTTEEFLHDLEKSESLDASHKPILKQFLEHCDLVKFATYKPENSEIQKTFDTCKEFIFGTQEKEKGVKT